MNQPETTLNEAEADAVFHAAQRIYGEQIAMLKAKLADTERKLLYAERKVEVLEAIIK